MESPPPPLQPAESEICTCVGGWPLKLQLYVISSPSTMVAGLMLRVAAHGVGGGDDGGGGDGGGGRINVTDA